MRLLGRDDWTHGGVEEWLGAGGFRVNSHKMTLVRSSNREGAGEID
jgi:hypothetical protein